MQPTRGPVYTPDLTYSPVYNGHPKGLSFPTLSITDKNGAFIKALPDLWPGLLHRETPLRTSHILDWKEQHVVHNAVKIVCIHIVALGATVGE